MNIKTTGLPWTTVSSASDNQAGRFNPSTQWMDPANFEKIRATLELQNICGPDIEVAVAYQLADVENSPQETHVLESYAGPAGYRSSEGMHFPNRWDARIAGQAEGRQLIRFGFLTRNKSGTGTSLNTARVAGRIEVFTC